MTSLVTPFPQDPKERLLILFPEDLLFLSVDEERTTVTYEVTGNSRNGQISTELRSGEQLWVMKINSRGKKGRKHRKAVFSFHFWRENSPWWESRERRNPLCWGGYSLKLQVSPVAVSGRKDCFYKKQKAFQCPQIQHRILLTDVTFGSTTGDSIQLKSDSTSSCNQTDALYGLLRFLAAKL